METKHYFHKQHPLTLCEINEIDGEFRCPSCSESCREPHGCSKCGFYLSRCSACDEKLSGNFYVCMQCRPESPLFHKACIDLPREIQIAYRSCCSLHFEQEYSLNDTLVCDFCNRTHRAYKFLCDVCDFQIGFRCAALLVKYQKGREHIEHFSHGHPLALFEVVDDMNCKLCYVRIDGTSYGCAPCGFYIHDSCRQWLEEIQNPLHPRHRLTMDLDEQKEYQCKACCFNFRGCRYICAWCQFDLHPGCLSLNRSINYKCHSHLLSRTENVFYESHCEECGFKIQNTFFLRCVECCLDFHVECSPRQLPSTILQKQHEHPLTLRFETGTEVGSHPLYCSACKKERITEHPFYYCVECEYVAHVRCVITELQYNDKGRLRHFSHEHILILRENQKNLDTFCYGCGEDIQGPTYGCDTCDFYLHKSCAELPKEIYGDHQHYLTLESLEENTGHDDRKHLSGFIYRCHHCKSVDCDWATNHPTNPKSRSIQFKYNDDQKHIGHFSHHHPLIILEVGDVNCQLCYQSINGRSYGCDPCKFYIHNSCSELPQEIRHHFHPLHYLTLRKLEHDRYRCNICRFNIQGFGYRCAKCDFDLHPSCMSLKPSIKYKDHEHLLILVENMSAVRNCEACGFEVKGAFFIRCVECSLDFHVECGPLSRLPPNVLQKQHKHPLALKIKAPFIDDSSLFHCDVCQKGINIEHPTYYCGECEYYAHVRCVINEVQVDEEEQLRHFSHKHFLFLTLPDKMKKDNICSACEKDIKSKLAYGCHYCEYYYLHKSCTKLPKVKHHPFHRHPLTLPTSFSRERRKCNACLRYCSGFTYDCEGCNFNLDLKCVQLYPSVESEDHEHILTFFQKSTEYLKCRNCKFAPSDDYSCPYISYLRCVKCNFNIHFLCSSSLPQTIEHDSHCHSLTFKDICITLSDRSYDNEYYCDICETRRDARECIYYCQECSFLVDIDCVISKVVDFLQGKHEDIQHRIVKKEITRQVTGKRSTFRGIVDSLTDEEKKILFDCIERVVHHEELQEFVQQMIDEDHSQHHFLPTAEDLFEFFQSLQMDDQLVNVGNYTTIQKYTQLLKNLLHKYGDFGASCSLSERLKLFSLVIFCMTVQKMTVCDFEDLEKDFILKVWVLLKFVQITGFEIDFFLEFLKRIKSAYLQTDSSTLWESPLYSLKRINEEIPQLSREIDERKAKIEKLNQKIAQHSRVIDERNAEIEKLRKQRQDIISGDGSEPSRMEAQQLNEALEFFCGNWAHGLP